MLGIWKVVQHGQQFPLGLSLGWPGTDNHTTATKQSNFDGWCKVVWYGWMLTGKRPWSHSSYLYKWMKLCGLSGLCLIEPGQGAIKFLVCFSTTWKRGSCMCQLLKHLPAQSIINQKTLELLVASPNALAGKQTTTMWRSLWMALSLGKTQWRGRIRLPN